MLALLAAKQTAVLHFTEQMMHFQYADSFSKFSLLLPSRLKASVLQSVPLATLSFEATIPNCWTSHISVVFTSYLCQACSACLWISWRHFWLQFMTHAVILTLNIHLLRCENQRFFFSNLNKCIWFWHDTFSGDTLKPCWSFYTACLTHSYKLWALQSLSTSLHSGGLCSGSIKRASEG